MTKTSGLLRLLRLRLLHGGERAATLRTRRRRIRDHRHHEGRATLAAGNRLRHNITSEEENQE